MAANGEVAIQQAEGHVLINLPKTCEVFYNPAQVLNRDLSIIAIKSFMKLSEKLMKRKVAESIAKSKCEGCHPPKPLKFKGLKILEPLAASGLRSLRYLKELKETVSHVVANDLDKAATQNILLNCKLNNISEDKITVFCKDATSLMYLASSLQQSNPSTQRLTSIPCGYTIDDEGGSATSREENSLHKHATLHDISINGATESKILQNHLVHKTSQDFAPYLSDVWLENVLFDVVDIDPYGSVSQFLDSSVQAIRSGGLLCLTSTDMPVLCGNTPGVAFYKYGGFPSKAKYMHELSLRLLMHAVTTTAAKYKRTVTPLACCSIDFYIRLFVRITVDAEGCKSIGENTAIAYQCRSCDCFVVLPLGESVPSKNSKQLKYRGATIKDGIGSKCAECGGQYGVVGPFYNGPLYQKDFLEECIAECNTAKNELPGLTLVPKIKGLLTAMSEELFDIPFFYHLPSLCHRLKLSMIKPDKFKSALQRLNYRVSHFHREPQAIKTDAPNYVIFDLLRKHALMHPPKGTEKCPILAKPISVENIDFSHFSTEQSMKREKVTRWLPNPEPFWGPKSKAKRKCSNDTNEHRITIHAPSYPAAGKNPLLD